MLLIGFKTENIGVGAATVSHQRMDIIKDGGDTLYIKMMICEYNAMVEKAKESQKKLSKIEDELEFSDMSEDEYLLQTTELLADIKILQYDRVLLVDGIILK
jgi:hypothetical protein